MAERACTPYTIEEVIEVVFPAAWVRDAISVVACEGGGDDTVGMVIGWFQLWDGWYRWAGEDPTLATDPWVAARVAIAVAMRDVAMGNDPWQQWQCQP